MSLVDKSILKGILDPSLSFYTTTRVFTTAQLIIDALADFGSYIRTFRIVNNDTGANCNYRQAAANALLKSVPPSSDVESQGWESYLEINPNAVTGTGFVELELVKYTDALRSDLAKQHIERLKQETSEQNQAA